MIEWITKGFLKVEETFEKVPANCMPETIFYKTEYIWEKGMINIIIE